jgi:hypothetical protein
VVTLGAYGRFRLSENWDLAVDGAYMALGVSNLDVSEYVLGGAGRYFVSRKVGFEAGYGVTSINLKISNSGGIIDPDTIHGKIRYSFQNFRLGVILALQ